MDHSERGNSKKQTGKKSPRVPIKTYKWEDVRRSRKRGGYPWTHLYKSAFNEHIDPEDFTMEALRKNKTSSASSVSDSLDIKEITEDDIKGLEGIDSSYVVIEGPILLGGQLDDSSKEHEGILESAESSDNISQYLDKEEPHQTESTETLTVVNTPQIETTSKSVERAKSEEPKRKRKLSVESNYSRISLSKLGLMKRFREAKEKIKLPTLRKSKSEKTIKVVEEVKERKPQTRKNEKPVYIHIPLKPPEGVTDEFSHLEFEEKPAAVKAMSTPDIHIEITEEENVGSENDESSTLKTQVESSENNSELKLPDDQDDDVSAIIFLEGDEEADNKGEYDIMVVDIDENSHEMKMSQVTNTEVKRQVLESIKRVESQSDLKEGKHTNLSRSSSKASRTSGDSIRKRRAKSVEPEKKRRSSIDSSHSRKSLSKISLLKKLQGIHLPFKRSSSKIDTAKKELPPPPPAPKPTASTKKDQQPVYIHIPLKPPPGVEDEFSHLETQPPTSTNKTEPTETTPLKTEAPDDTSPVESPESPKGPQFIFLIPPSDDELLDKPDIPDTPSTDTTTPFQLGELKQLAKKAFDQVHGLDSVNEEQDNTIKENTDDETIEKITIDEEDGLKSTRDETKSALKSNPKGTKKKVSFKRRKSSQTSKDDGYEEIQPPPTEVTVGDTIQQQTQIVSVVTQEEQKTVDEDFREWSKSSDHEYEPINPPPLEKTEPSPPKSHVSEVLNPLLHLPDDDIELDLTLQYAASEIENAPRRSPSRSRSKEKELPKPNKFQVAMKERASKFKSKFQNIKRPNFSLPSKPKFRKPNIKKPNINLPKMPDFSTTFRRKSKEEGTTATTSNNDNSNNKDQGVFQFSTFPRLFKKRKRDFDSTSLGEANTPVKERTTQKPQKESDTVSRTDSIRIPLHSEESMDQDKEISANLQLTSEPEELQREIDSPLRYQEDIEADDEDILQKARQERHRAANAAAATVDTEEEENRWQHGNFYETDNGIHESSELKQQRLDIEDRHIEDEIITDLDQPEEIQPTVPTRHRSKLQQNDSIDTNHSKDAGSSMSSLGQYRRGVLEEVDSDQFFLREKGISQDNIDMGRYLSTEIREAFRTPTNALANIQAYNYEEMRASNQSLPEMKKKQMKKPRRRKTSHSSQERLRYEQESENEDYNFMPPIRPRRRSKRRKKTEAVRYDETENPQKENLNPLYYENQKMEGIEQPDILVSTSYRNMLHVQDMGHRRASEPIPSAPPRKHKSLKSLNASEHDSIFDEYDRNNDNPDRLKESTAPPDFEFGQQPPPRPPKRPSRSRSKTKSMSAATSQAESVLDRNDSILSDDAYREPVIEEPCIKDLRDAMGYAIVDKNQNKNWEHKFCTVPRSHGTADKPPERPLRNYSTLGPVRPTRKLSKNMTDEEKEVVDITQYIEIDDERDLQSGELIQKIQNRPLPAPPRPPRSRSKSTQDMTAPTAEENDETEVSTQTEPLPPDFVCEEMVHEETDKVMTPSALRKNEPHLVTPTKYIYEEETITHGQLLVEPLNGSQILPDTQTSRERIVPVTSEEEEETSEIPETFKKLENPQPLDLLKTQTLQVTDLDVNRLNVNELVANKIVVSEIDSGNITSKEISSKSGALRLGDIELEPNVVKKLLEQLQESSKQQQQSILETESIPEQKKTPMSFSDLDEPSPVQEDEFPNGNVQDISETQAIECEPCCPDVEALETEIIQEEVSGPEPPTRPPRRLTASEINETNELLEMLEPEVDDEPPPRPPNPQIPYVPSQPPASFYDLRAQQYLEAITDDIPLVPRRKRHHHRPPTIPASSSSDAEVPVPRRRVKSPEPSIPQLAGQLLCACSVVTRNTIKRLIEKVNNNITTTSQADGDVNRQNIQVIIVILLVLIAGLLLLGYGDGKTVHLHHWEYFNPPTDI